MNRSTSHTSSHTRTSNSASRFASIIFLMGTLFTGNAFALPEDRYQRIDIVSDNARLDNLAGTVIYEGRVMLTQGTLMINADKLVAYRNSNNAIDKIIAEGKPARYQQIANPGEPLTKAKGQKIEYYASDEKLMLYKQAGLTQGENLFTGNEIEYDMKNQKVVAKGDSSSRDKDGRIRMVIQPENDEQQNDNDTQEQKEQE